MNHYVPDWNMEDYSRYFRDFPTEDHHNSLGPESDLVELLWQNGNVVMHSQNHKHATSADLKQELQRSKRAEQSLGESSTLIQEDETAPWLQYPMDHSLDKDFSADFVSEMASMFGFSYDKASKEIFTGKERHLKISSNSESSFSARLASVQQKDLCASTMPPPKLNTTHSVSQAPALLNDSFTNFPHFSRSDKSLLGSLSKKLGDKELVNETKVRGEESSIMTVVGSSISGSNRLQASVHQNGTSAFNETDDIAAGGQEETDRDKLLSEGMQRNAYEITITSSSGGSGSSVGRSGQQSLSNQNQKRKERELECQSEEAEHESVRVTKAAKRSTSTRRSRAAEVHNLSERVQSFPREFVCIILSTVLIIKLEFHVLQRRRDRINEKMKALQDLIPHCNKTDKASMLDEAIEYLKSLQLQAQMMWMGSGMAPMMFPGVGQCMPSMAMGMPHASLPSLHNSVQLPRVPSTSQAMLFPSPGLNGANFPNQMQNINRPESYPHFLVFHQMQPHPQAINFFSYGPHINQQNQSAGAPNGSIMPNAGGAAPENIGANNKPG